MASSAVPCRSTSKALARLLDVIGGHYCPYVRVFRHIWHVSSMLPGHRPGSGLSPLAAGYAQRPGLPCPGHWRPPGRNLHRRRDPPLCGSHGTSSKQLSPSMSSFKQALEALCEAWWTCRACLLPGDVQKTKPVNYLWNGPSGR